MSFGRTGKGLMIFGVGNGLRDGDVGVHGFEVGFTGEVREGRVHDLNELHGGAAKRAKRQRLLRATKGSSMYLINRIGCLSESVHCSVACR